MPLHPKPCHLLPYINPDLVLPFWCWLTQVVQEKEALNRCTSSSSSNQKINSIARAATLFSVSRESPLKHCIWITFHSVIRLFSGQLLLDSLLVFCSLSLNGCSSSSSSSRVVVVVVSVAAERSALYKCSIDIDRVETYTVSQKKTRH